MESIIIIDKNVSDRNIADSLLSSQYDVTTSCSIVEALKIVNSIKPNVIILDISCCSMDGITMLQKSSPSSAIIFSASTAGIVKHVKQNGAVYLQKPFTAENLHNSVLYSLAEKANSETKQVYNSKQILGNNINIINIRKKIIKYAIHDAPVLILGETGTGKELAAYEIHNQSKRRNEPFIPVDCASIPNELAESLFFGTKKGAYTGAIENSGIFEAANGGTLFFDEIAEMPLHIQAKLLRVLETKSGTKLGSVTPVSYDVRIIAATNSNIHLMPERFRPELLNRINTLVINLPCLRSHKEDIELLVESFFEELHTKKRLSKEAINKLQKWDWPGNVRELKNVIYRAVILSDTNEIINAEHIEISPYELTSIS